jgi:hypothetical protein
VSNVMWFLHLLGAVGMGFYIVLPVLLGKAPKLAGGGQEGLAEGLSSANRIAQYFLVVQLLTGGYIMSQGNYSPLWMVLVTVLFLGIAAVSGMMSKPLKQIVGSIRENRSATAYIAKARAMSFAVLIMYLVIIYLMKFPF